VEPKWGSNPQTSYMFMERSNRASPKTRLCFFPTSDFYKRLVIGIMCKKKLRNPCGTNLGAKVRIAPLQFAFFGPYTLGSTRIGRQKPRLNGRNECVANGGARRDSHAKTAVLCPGHLKSHGGNHFMTLVASRQPLRRTGKKSGSASRVIIKQRRSFR